MNSSNQLATNNKIKIITQLFGHRCPDDQFDIKHGVAFSFIKKGKIIHFQCYNNGQMKGHKFFPLIGFHEEVNFGFPQIINVCIEFKNFLLNIDNNDEL